MTYKDKKPYQCVYCGRNFGRASPHRCCGNMRWRKLRFNYDKKQAEIESLRHFIEDRIMDDRGWQQDYEAFLDELNKEELGNPGKWKGGDDEGGDIIGGDGGIR